MEKKILRKYYIHILLIILGTILYFLSNIQRAAIPAPIFDILQSELNVSATKITTFSAVFMYCYALGTLLCGVLVDKFGGIRVMFFGTILFSLGNLLFPLVDNLYMMYLARGLVGIGGATFYLSLLSEVKKCFKDKYTGIAISFIIFFGCMGGVCANAPFVIMAERISWQNTLHVFTLITCIVTVLFIFIQHFLKCMHPNDKVHMNLEPFIEVLKNKNNYYLCTFISICTSLYYVIMTVLGVKFLKDFLGYSTSLAATIVSCIVIIAALSSVGLASLSNLMHNQRVIFLKFAGYLSFIIFSIISLCIFFDVKTNLIAGLILVLAITGGTTPISAPIVLNTNKYEVRTTSISVINSVSFVLVGLIATLIGVLLDFFPAVGKINGNIIYGKESYLTVFLFFTFLALIEIIMTYKIKEKLN